MARCLGFSKQANLLFIIIGFSPAFFYIIFAIELFGHIIYNTVIFNVDCMLLKKKTVKGNKSPFTEKFLAEIEESLLKEKDRLSQELLKFTKKTKTPGDFEANFPEYGDKEDENANEVAEYTANKPLEDVLESMLADVNKALRRLEKGTYGICKYCDRPIDEKRLRARATSGACVACKKTLTDEV